MAKQYLDKTGLQSFWNKIKGTFVDSSKLTFNLNGNTLELLEQTGVDRNNEPVYETLATQDVSSFVKDGMLDSVTVSDDGYLVFTFNQASGPDGTTAKNPIRIPITEIFDPDEFYKKSEVDTLIKTTRDIEINGGVLADDVTASTDAGKWPETWYKKAENGGFDMTKKCIPQGLSLTDIISGLFLRELWPSIRQKKTATLVPQITAVTPVITAETKFDILEDVDGILTIVDSLVEIGDTLTVEEMTVSAQTYGGETTTSVGTFTNGYKTTENGTVIGKGTDISVSRTKEAPQKDTDTYSLTVKVGSGFTDASVPTIIANSKASSVKCESFTGIAIAGSNQINTTVTGVAAKAEVGGIEPVYIVSSLGNVDNVHMSPKVEAKNLTASAPSTPGSASVTGVYRLYTSGTQSTEGNHDIGSIVWGPNERNPLNLVDYSSDQTTYIAFGSTSGRAWKVYLPNSLNLSISAKSLNTIMWIYDNELSASKTGTETITTLAGNIEYDVWTINSPGAANNIEVTIKTT